MGEICCAIERIDHPFCFGWARSGHCTGFFRKNCMIRIAFANRLNDQRFTLFVRGRDEIRATFQLDRLFAIRVVV